MKIVVCIPTRNRVELLKRAVDSVFSSIYQNFNIIIFNDNSSDGTNSYLESLKKEKLITEIRHKHSLGHIGNANYIFSNIDYEFLLILHDDDTIEQMLLGKKIEMIQLDPNIVMVGSGWSTINEDDEKIEVKTYHDFSSPIILNDREYFLHHFNGLNFPWSGTLFRQSKIKDFRFSDYYGIAADAVFMADIVVGNKVGYIPESLSNYRIHEDQITHIPDFSEKYEQWTKVWNFYDGIVLQNYNEKIFKKKSSIAKNKTIIYLLINAPNISIFFKILKSKHFTKNIIRFIDILRLVKKFIKLLFNRSNSLEG